MSSDAPLDKSIEELQHIIDRIGSEKSPVGIDAKLTHAIIIEYLRQISARVEAIERHIDRGDHEMVHKQK